MKNIFNQKPLPEKVIVRLEEILFQLLPVLEDSVADGRAADAELSTWLRARRELGSRDRRFLSESIFRHFRWMGWTRVSLKLNLPEATLLSALLEQEAPTQWSEYLSKKIKLKMNLESLGPLSIAEKTAHLNKAFGSKLTEMQLITADAELVIEPDVLSDSLPAFQLRPPTWIRSRIESEELISIFKDENIPIQQSSQQPFALAIPGGINLQQRLEKGSGQFIIQDFASQCVGHICAPLAGQIWWDCCAGAGGKSLHLADLMKQQGGLLASDIRDNTLIELKKRSRQAGIRMIQSQVLDAAKETPGIHLYDGVLVDAPCSGWGTWSRNPDARWRTSVKDVRQSARRQKAILQNVAKAVKPGGCLIYAVCTLTKPETTEQVEAFLQTNPIFELEAFRHPITGEQVSEPIQIIPNNYNAMFIARFRRKN